MRARFNHALRELRGRARHRLGRAAARLLGRHTPAGRLQPDGIASVLICRINARMGNAVLLTPLIKRLHELLPRASIDIAISYPHADDLLGRLPGVRRIIRFPYKGVQLAWRYVAALRRVRREHYDLVIDPSPHSTSGRIVLTIARARRRLGYTTRDQWAPLTHGVPIPASILHQAAQPAVLLSRALGAGDELGTLQLWLPLERDEVEAGRAAIARALAASGRRAESSQAFGFFAHATGLKTVDRGYWRAFLDAFAELEPDAVPLEILPSPSSAPTDARCATLHIPSPRALTAALAALRLFVSADTGPMHLASIAVPTVALFRASDPALFGPLKPADLALEVSRYTPHAAAECCQRLWRRAERVRDFERQGRDEAFAAVEPPE
ncbi:MAG: glycosyltransferase family 9 protein [Steroidobacteraceae bacterium]